MNKEYIFKVDKVAKSTITISIEASSIEGAKSILSAYPEGKGSNLYVLDESKIEVDSIDMSTLVLFKVNENLD